MLIPIEDCEVRWRYWVREDSPLVEWLMRKAPWLDFERMGAGWIVTCWRPIDDFQRPFRSWLSDND
jgi:hypothetical protein